MQDLERFNFLRAYTTTRAYEKRVTGKQPLEPDPNPNPHNHSAWSNVMGQNTSVECKSLNIAMYTPGKRDSYGPW